MVLLIDGPKGIAYRTDIMVLLLLHMLIHALHAHCQGLLLAVEHQGLFMHVAFHLRGFLALAAFIVSCAMCRIVACFTVAIIDLWSFPIRVNVVSSLSVRHLSQFALT
jgi:ABC-type uncharacterized transport system permease subunit